MKFRSDPATIRRSIASVVTPFTDEGAVDHDSLRSLIRFQLESGSHGISLGGSTGEPSAQTVAERIATMPRASNRSTLPVFIVGMPRSGTTLTEQIIASHGQVFGAGEYSMRVWLDPNKLAAKSMTATDVIRAIKEQNVQVAAGRIGHHQVPRLPAGFGRGRAAVLQGAQEGVADERVGGAGQRIPLRGRDRPHRGRRCLHDGFELRRRDRRQRAGHSAPGRARSRSPAASAGGHRLERGRDGEPANGRNPPLRRERGE